MLATHGRSRAKVTGAANQPSLASFRAVVRMYGTTPLNPFPRKVPSNFESLTDGDFGQSPHPLLTLLTVSQLCYKYAVGQKTYNPFGVLSQPVWIDPTVRVYISPSSSCVCSAQISDWSLLLTYSWATRGRMRRPRT